MIEDSRPKGLGAAAIRTWIKGRLTRSSITDPDEVLAGKGAIVQVGPKKVAVYRDEDGRIHSRSPVCTHMQCIVDWNDSEKTWDCPCHGSRYDPYGHVIQGPAKKSLAEVEPEDEL